MLQFLTCVIFLSGLFALATPLASFCQEPRGLERPRQIINCPDGDVFMEEVQSNRPDAQGSPTAPKVEMKHAPDIYDLGVPVSSSGRIVPLIQRESGGFMPLYSSMTASYEPLWGYPLYRPYYRWPGYLGSRSSPDPNFPRTVPLTYGYPGYPWTAGGYNPYGPWVAPYPVQSVSVNLRLGKMNLSLGTGSFIPVSSGRFSSSGLLAPLLASP